MNIDTELLPGAANAVNVCLRVQPGEKVTVIADQGSSPVASALLAELDKIDCEIFPFILEELAPRPLRAMPEPVLKALEESQVSLFTASAQPGELTARIEMMGVVNRRRIRHGHMVNIDRSIMLQGMRADFREIDRLSQRLIELARECESISARSSGGTEIEARFSKDLHWIKTSGIITPEKWGNLPGGEIFTSPLRVDGVFVTDGVVGDYLCSKYGDLEENPLVIEIEDSRIRGIHCENPDLLEEFRAYTATDENSNRVGEFAIGTNLAVRKVIGNILQDEKIPGLHIAFGHPYSEHTGQTWTSTTHIDCVGRCFDISIDGTPVMSRGEFLLSA